MSLLYSCSKRRVCVSLGMDEEENTDRKLRIAMLCQKLEKMKRYFNDGDLFFFFNDAKCYSSRPATSV